MPPALPKLSYVLLSHNREQYIREAIESAFAQEYDGELEYIFSDDCSTDNTFAIMQECVAAYKGTRRVVLTQTPHNCHLASHACHAACFATGDWIVRADDDDLSFPDRCSHIAEAIRHCPQALCFLEPLQSVDDAACTPSNIKFTVPRAAWRCMPYDWKALSSGRISSPISQVSVKTYAKQLYTHMGALPPEAFSVDDVTLVLRALSIGTVVALSGPPSILYRRNASTLSGTVDGSGSVEDIRLKEEKLSRVYRNHLGGLRAVLQQFQAEAARHPSEAMDYIAGKLLPQLVRQTETSAEWWQLSTWKRLKQWRHEKAGVSKFTFGLARTLPYPIAIRLYSLIKRVKNKLA